MAQPRVLIACIGNIFLGDDAFGVEVAKRLAGRKLPDEVRLKDFGIRGFDLAYALLDEYEVTILVDATPRGGAPGTLYLIEPDLSELEVNNAQTAALDTHGMNPMKVLQMARSMGAQFQQILLVGCEPMTFGSEEQGQMELSEPVAAAVDEALRMIESLIAKMLATDIRQQAIPSTAT